MLLSDLKTALALTFDPFPLPGLATEILSPSLLFVLFLAGVSPILRTLTESVSTDTIWAMTVSEVAMESIANSETSVHTN